MIPNLTNVQGVIADMDGVLWRGNDPLPGAAEFFAALEIPYVFATNNSTRSVGDYVEKLGKMGITATPAQIVTSATATAAYLAGIYPAGTKIFVVGEAGLKQALQAHGFTLVSATGGQPHLVVAGLDRYLSYDKLAVATLHIQRGAAFIGTNGDKTFPVPQGVAPGAGSILAALETACGHAPQVVVGKPEPPMFEIALQILGTLPEYTLMIGDRLETDILGAQRMGIRTALMLSGISSEADVSVTGIQPEAVYQDLAHFLLEKPFK